MEEKDLIFTISGIRGIFGKSLNNDIIKKIAAAYGLWLKGDIKEVVIGRDTRPSGEAIEKLSKSLVKKIINLIILNMKKASVDKDDLSLARSLLMAFSNQDESIKKTLEKLDHELSRQ